VILLLLLLLLCELCTGVQEEERGNGLCLIRSCCVIGVYRTVCVTVLFFIVYFV